MSRFRPADLAVAVAAAAAMYAAPSFAAQSLYTTALDGASESPPVVSAGVGFAIVTVDDTAFTMRLQTIFAGLTGNVTAAHIHCCTAVPGAGNIGVATTTPSFTGFPAGGTSGSYDMTFNMLDPSSWNAPFITNNGGTVEGAFAALSAGLNSGSAYLNIHSTHAPGGEIRGFLAPVPEPASYALMAGGLALVGWMARRRRT